ncbi:uncharacterized protein I303_107707 [Kwoniella dejecticola CBS 10117]|uniref:Histone deacetylase HOS3 n=1 Tax=Kwoniella dejecticola CBS 10117 TaxID=1296121 RepID=A0A1A5ZVH1_9TREE|nr:histone deacetylase HOS3 [Kwoniella dejecticola CBS 10117]OBR81804.1 histone deacetylase HOS3 [Kwoniella dejecticola CBS 10117]
MTASPPRTSAPLGLFIQPACLQHKYIRHANSSHIFERPERLRAVLLGVAAAVARLETLDSFITPKHPATPPSSSTADDLSGLLSSLSIASSTASTSRLTSHLNIVPPPPIPSIPGSILLHHPAVQLAHSPAPEAPFPYLGIGSSSSSSSANGDIPSSEYLKNLVKWASEAIDKIKETGCEIPPDLGLNPGDLYLGPGSIVAIEGAIQTVCQAVDHVVSSRTPLNTPATNSQTPQIPSTPPAETLQHERYFSHPPQAAGPSAEGASFNKAFCAIRPPGHHCGEDLPSGFCYVNNVVVGAMHAYLQHDIDRAIIIDFDLHHGNGTQALVMPLNAAAHAEELQVKAGKPQTMTGRDGRKRRGWKGFYGSVHDIYSYPCEDGDVDLIKDASISLAAHGQYIENIHLQPYEDEADFYARIYPLYLALLNKAKVYMEETQAEPSRTIVFISAGFDACEHEHQGMQRHDRRVPTSFYSRYTKDIAAFADQHTEGKIVSVLEGGYSDRALTSAAMGHIVGMKGVLPEGCDAWWTEQELINIEKATKKRRTGKLAPFPSEFSAQSHLQRTHTLFSHFEGGSGGVDSTAPSVQSTPLPNVRMTLRDRRKPEDIALPPSAENTPVAPRRAVRGRGGGASTLNTPTRTKKDHSSTTTTTTNPSPNTAESTATPTQAGRTVKAVTPGSRSKGLKVDDVPSPASRADGPLDRLSKDSTGVEEVLEGLGGIKIADATSKPAMPVHAQAQKPDPSPIVLNPASAKAEIETARPHMQAAPAPNNTPSASEQTTTRPPLPAQTSIPKIILRIPRPPQAQTPLSSDRSDISSLPSTPSANSHQPPQQKIHLPTRDLSNSIYSPLPRFGSRSELQFDSQRGSGERLDYREGSTSTEGASTETETEYLTATSGGESPLPSSAKKEEM